MASIEDRVRDLAVDQLGVSEDQVSPQASFIDDLGADSLDTVELVMAFEEEFGIDIPDDDAEKMSSVGDDQVFRRKQQILGRSIYVASRRRVVVTDWEHW